MTQWEYWNYPPFYGWPNDQASNLSEWLHGLNELGRAGWELVGPVRLERYGHTSPTGTLLLKRPVK